MNLYMQIHIHIHVHIDATTTTPSTPPSTNTPASDVATATTATTTTAVAAAAVANATAEHMIICWHRMDLGILLDTQCYIKSTIGPHKRSNTHNELDGVTALSVRPNQIDVPRVG